MRARLTGFAILGVAAILAVMGAFVRFRVQHNLVAEIDRQLLADTKSVKTGPNLPPPELPSGKKILDPISKTTVRHAEGADRVIQVLKSRSGEVQLETQWTPPRLIPVHEGTLEFTALPPGDLQGYRRALTEGQTYHDYVDGAEPMRSLSMALRQNGEVIAVVQSVRPMAPVRHQLADLDAALAMSIPVALALAAFGGALLVGSTMRPLRRMTDSARRLEADLSSSRLPVEGADEFSELASTINAAFDRTSAAFASQTRALAQLERFTGDAGHELRTPLASIKANASYLLHMTDLDCENVPAVRAIDVSADRMSKLIGDLLLLARQDGAKTGLHPSPVYVEELVRCVIDGFAVPDDLAVTVVVESDLEVCADSDSVERVLINLASNAIAHARTSVCVSACRSGGFLMLTVEDDGEGVEPEHLARLGERFYRPDEARSRQHGGVGLGLAIVKSLTASHGGRLTITSEVGKGTKAEATFAV